LVSPAITSTSAALVKQLAEIQIFELEVSAKPNVYPRKSGSRIWAYIVKRMVARFCWNFYTEIWHLYAFLLIEIFFRPWAAFLERQKEKNKTVFRKLSLPL
jgi:hypothetical protein